MKDYTAFLDVWLREFIYGNREFEKRHENMSCKGPYLYSYDMHIATLFEPAGKSQFGFLVFAYAALHVSATTSRHLRLTMAAAHRQWGYFKPRFTYSTNITGTLRDAFVGACIKDANKINDMLADIGKRWGHRKVRLLLVFIKDYEEAKTAVAKVFGEEVPLDIPPQKFDILFETIWPIKAIQKITPDALTSHPPSKEVKAYLREHFPSTDKGASNESA